MDIGGESSADHTIVCYLSVRARGREVYGPGINIEWVSVEYSYTVEFCGRYT